MKNTIARKINKKCNQLCLIVIALGALIATPFSHCVAKPLFFPAPMEPEFLNKVYDHYIVHATGERCISYFVHEDSLCQGEAKDVEVYAITNNVGSVLKMSNLGCTVMSLTMPDVVGVFENVLLEFENPEDYTKTGQISTICGRVANSTSFGKFMLDGVEYNTNEEIDSSVKKALYSGKLGLDKKKWHLLERKNFPYKDNQLVFYYVSPDKEDGFPGNLLIFAAYTLTDNQELVVEFYAFTDKTTICNLTQKLYFNLGGIKENRTAKNIENTLVRLNCDRVMEIKKGGIPTGKLLSVEGTDLDFRNDFYPISKASKSDAEQIKFAYGLKHCFFVEPPAKQNHDESTFALCSFYNPQLKVVASVVDPYNGRQLDIATDQQSVVFYAGGFIGKHLGSSGCNYEANTAFCLDTQAPIDAQYHAHLGSIRLAPFQKYTSKTVYKFSVSEYEYDVEYVKATRKKQRTEAGVK